MALVKKEDWSLLYQPRPQGLLSLLGRMTKGPGEEVAVVPRGGT